jgi:hypothetical protein
MLGDMLSKERKPMALSKCIPVAKAIMLVMAVVWYGCLAAQDREPATCHLRTKKPSHHGDGL